ncbi:transposase [Corynebacterium tuberculostearicum]|uniref:transposase n=1 Tax=Corynebacterium tuberculostearicum TaxID=38304 RepID=UPI0038D06CBF
MSRYSEQFRRDAVALYENNEDLSLNAASAELGINLASLHSWVKKYGTGKRSRINAVHEKAGLTPGKWTRRGLAMLL